GSMKTRRSEIENLFSIVQSKVNTVEIDGTLLGQTPRYQPDELSNCRAKSRAALRVQWDLARGVDARGYCSRSGFGFFGSTFGRIYRLGLVVLRINRRQLFGNTRPKQ